MEYMENGNLFEFLRSKEGKKLSADQLREMFVKIAQAVAYIHSHNLIHRDLKPENILLDKELNPKICDFGWTTKVQKNESRLTFCGTYEYMAPEIFENDEYNKSVDIWSLGILLYEMFHLQSPFAGKSAFKIYRNIVEEKISLKRNLDSDAVDLILKLLRNDPKKRPNIQQLLKHAFVKKTIRMRQPPLTSRRYKKSKRKDKQKFLKKDLGQSNLKISKSQLKKAFKKKPKAKKECSIDSVIPELIQSMEEIILDDEEFEQDLS